MALNVYDKLFFIKFENTNSKFFPKSSTNNSTIPTKNFDLTKNIVWVCSRCGHTHIGSTYLNSCPVCNSPYHVFEA